MVSTHIVSLSPCGVYTSSRLSLRLVGRRGAGPCNAIDEPLLRPSGVGWWGGGCHLGGGGSACILPWKSVPSAVTAWVHGEVSKSEKAEPPWQVFVG